MGIEVMLLPLATSLQQLRNLPTGSRRELAISYTSCNSQGSMSYTSPGQYSKAHVGGEVTSEQALKVRAWRACPV